MRTNRFLSILILSLFSAFAVEAQDPKQTPSPTPTPNVVGEVTVSAQFANTDPLYQKIRQNLSNLNLSGECATVNNLVLTKDKGIFTLKSGEIYFLAPVEGKVTGAVFLGDGEFALTPPVEVEKKHLSIFTGAPEVKEQFGEMVIYFTDKTYEAVKNSLNSNMTSGCSRISEAKSALEQKSDVLKKQFTFNMSSRILADFYTPKRRGFFTALIEGKKYGKLYFKIDPLGVTDEIPRLGIFGVYPEQVALISYDRDNSGVWTAFHLESEYSRGTANSWADRRIYDISDHKIDIVIKGGRLISNDTITLQSRTPDLRFFPFDLYETLRVKAVRDENGNELSFIQEKKDEDADFGVILDKAPEVGKPFKITVEYEGDGALIKVGSGNFFLGPRSTWYPNNPFTAFADRANFDLTYRYAKRNTLVSGGNRVGEDKIEGDTKVSQWSTEGIEYEVMGFNYGDFKSKVFKDPASGYDLEVFANAELPDFMKDYQKRVELFEARSSNREGGNMVDNTVQTTNTVEGVDKIMIEAQNSARLFNAYFGKLPYKRIAMTQQPAGFFGQSWTTLVYMPFFAYFDKNTVKQYLGARGALNDFWTTVGPHEVAHQWWGHIVGWTSYRDQWMSEGFSELSASIYIQFVEKDIDRFIESWEDQRKMIVTATNQTKNLKPYTIGPLTQGYRLNSGKTGNAARYMIYPKGAYVLHMLRMMMYDHGKTGDARFKAMMQDFIKANYNKPVSTEDFKKAVERNITPEMDIDKNKKIDWFFDQWIYGTEMPSYKFEYQVNGDQLTGQITQSGVSKNFVMIVPIYADFGNSWQYLGSVTMAGNDTIDIGKFKLPNAPKKVAIAALKDVLAENVENIKR